MAGNDMQTKALLSSLRPQKLLTRLVLRFIEEQGISPALSKRRRFTRAEALALIVEETGFMLGGGLRARMILTLLDLLVECDYVRTEGAHYVWTGNGMPPDMLPPEEEEMTREQFGGEVRFFERCIASAPLFLRGGEPLYGFDGESLPLWEEFLGNEEFRFARSLLAKLLHLGSAGKPDILDLCCGPGFDLISLQEELPEARVTALDFKNIFHAQALRRTLHPDAVRWVLWNGFGSPLPFPEESFHIVFFSCADPYIPPHLREQVYRDIFRVLKKGGALGILSHSYPDPERTYVKDPWTRRGILCHDFAESVCAGWHGFCGARESVLLFEAIGFRPGDIMLDASLWRLEKP